MVIIKGSKNKKKIHKQCSGKGKHEESSSGRVNTLDCDPIMIKLRAAREAGEVFTVIHGATRRRPRTHTVPKKTITKANLDLQCTNVYVTYANIKGSYTLLEIIGLENPTGLMYTTLGMMPRGTIIKVDVSGIGMETPAEEKVFEKYAKVTNDPEIDGRVYAKLIF